MVSLPIGLRQNELFAQLLNEPPDVIYEANATVFREGELADHLLYLVKGRVRMSVTSPAGSQVDLVERGPGQVIGEMSLVTGLRCASARALEQVTALRVSHAVIVQLINARPDFALALYALAIERLYEANQMLARQIGGCQANSMSSQT